MGRMHDWIMYALVVSFVILVVLAALILIGPPIKTCFCGGIYSPTAVPPTAVPTPKRLPSVKRHCQHDVVSTC